MEGGIIGGEQWCRADPELKPTRSGLTQASRSSHCSLLRRALTTGTAGDCAEGGPLPRVNDLRVGDSFQLPSAKREERVDERV